MITNSNSGTGIDEVEGQIYRINTPVALGDMKFSFNQYLIVDQAPVLFHTGPRRLFEHVRDAVATVLPLERLRYIGFSHFEADECGALNEFLAVAPQAVPLCGRVAAMVSVTDVADRAPKVMQADEFVDIGDRSLRWLETPHLPHGWDCGMILDERSRTLFCSDLFTQGGAGETALTENDILESSEAFRALDDYYAHAPNTVEQLEHLAATAPRTLACMHGSAWRGDGASLLKQLAKRLAR